MKTSDAAFNEIALSLSGGGYRAAAFHLGTLEMLNRLDLLSSVRVLSTVSGGTITGVAYAASLSENLTFDDFYQKLYGFLHNTNVITDALSTIQDSTRINQQYTMPSLIRAAAGVYASNSLFANKTFDLLFNHNCRQLKEIAFNATDFRSGNCFRFQKSDSSLVRTGNNGAKVEPEINLQIRLADIVAASSCFPSGFEPIRFPSDFVWGDGKQLDRIRRELGERFAGDIPLMDGGVFDNQGIDSIENIYERKGAEIDLYIVSDTDQRDATLLDFPLRERHGRSGPSLNFLYFLIWILLILSLLTAIAIVADAAASLVNGSLTVAKGIFLYFIPFVFSVVVVLLILWARSSAVKMQSLVLEKTGFALWPYLKKLSVPEIVELIDSRVKSLISMSSSVFMKRIRDLGYNKIFSDPDFQNKILPNVIYDLDNSSKWGKEIMGTELQPSEKLRLVSKNAESYSTNLWFLKPDDLDNLIFCGQATMCFKILKYLLKHRAVELSDTESSEFKLFENAKSIWIQMNQ